MWLGGRWILLWGRIDDPLRVHSVLFAAAGLVMLLAGTGLLARRPSPALRWGGASASALCGANLLAGIATGAIPCGGGG